jgi:hypothetical protein
VGSTAPPNAIVRQRTRNQRRIPEMFRACASAVNQARATTQLSNDLRVGSRKGVLGPGARSFGGALKRVRLGLVVAVLEGSAAAEAAGRASRRASSPTPRASRPSGASASPPMAARTRTRTRACSPTSTRGKDCADGRGLEVFVLRSRSDRVQFGYELENPACPRIAVRSCTPLTGRMRGIRRGVGAPPLLATSS